MKTQFCDSHRIRMPPKMRLPTHSSHTLCTHIGVHFFIICRRDIGLARAAKLLTSSLTRQFSMSDCRTSTSTYWAEVK